MTSLDLLVADGSIRTVAPDSGYRGTGTVSGHGRRHGADRHHLVGRHPDESDPIVADLSGYPTPRQPDDLMAEMVSADEVHLLSCLDRLRGERPPLRPRRVDQPGEHASLDQLPKAKADDPLAYDPSMLATAPPFVPGAAEQDEHGRVQRTVVPQGA